MDKQKYLPVICLYSPLFTYLSARERTTRRLGNLFFHWHRRVFDETLSSRRWTWRGLALLGVDGVQSTSRGDGEEKKQSVGRTHARWRIGWPPRERDSLGSHGAGNSAKCTWNRKRDTATVKERSFERMLCGTRSMTSRIPARASPRPRHMPRRCNPRLPAIVQTDVVRARNARCREAENSRTFFARARAKKRASQCFTSALCRSRYIVLAAFFSDYNRILKVSDDFF